MFEIAILKNNINPNQLHEEIGQLSKYYSLIHNDENIWLSFNSVSENISPIFDEDGNQIGENLSYTFTALIDKTIIDEEGNEINLKESVITDITQEILDIISLIQEKVDNHDSLKLLKQSKDNDLTKLCSQTIEGGFIATNGRKYGTDSKHDQPNFTQQMISILKGDTKPIYWKNELTGLPEEHTVDEFLVVIDEFAKFKVENQTKLWNLRQQILNATTKEELDLIVWE